MCWMISIHLSKKTPMPVNSDLLALIKNQVCYTDLVCQRVNKRLKVDLSWQISF